MDNRTHAAAAILALINASPRTPTAAEIAGVLARVIPSAWAPEATPSQLTLELRRVRLLYHVAVDEELNAEDLPPVGKSPAYQAACAKSQRIHEEFEALAQQVRKRPVENLDDVVMRVEWALSFDGGTLEELYDGCPCLRATMAVIGAVAVLGGCPLRPLKPEFLNQKGDVYGTHHVGWLERIAIGGSGLVPEVRPAWG